MTGKSCELASAALLADSAFEMLIDAASILKDAGDQQEYQQLNGLAGELSKAIEKLRKRKAEIEAAEPANENDPKV